MEEPKEINIGSTFIGVVVAIGVFVAVWILGGTLFGLFDNLRGLGDDKFQALFRELLVPGSGGYAAMVVTRLWIQRASTKFLFLGFSIVVLILVGFFFGYFGQVAEKIGSNMWEVFLGAVSLGAAVVGAYIQVKDEI